MVNKRSVFLSGSLMALALPFLIPFAGRADDLQFPDSAGTIVSRDTGHVVRLLPTPGSSAEVAEAQ